MVQYKMQYCPGRRLTLLWSWQWASATEMALAAETALHILSLWAETKEDGTSAKAEL